MHPISVKAYLVVSGVLFCHTCAENAPTACLDVCRLMLYPFMTRHVTSSHGLQAWTDNDYHHLNVRGAFHRYRAAHPTAEASAALPPEENA